MFKTTIFLILINIFFLATKSSACEDIYLIDLTQSPKIIKPIFYRPLPQRPKVETEFPELQNLQFSEKGLDTFSDPNIPERPKTPSPFNHSLATRSLPSITEEEEEKEEEESKNSNTFSVNLNPVNFVAPFSAELTISDQIIKKNWRKLLEDKFISLDILMLFRAHASMIIDPQQNADYQQMINQHIQKHEA